MPKISKIQYLPHLKFQKYETVFKKSYSFLRAFQQYKERS